MNLKGTIMKKCFFKYASVILMLALTGQLLPMAAPGQGIFGGVTMQEIAHLMGQMMDGAANAVQQVVRERQEDQRIERARLEQALNNPHATQDARGRARAALERLDQEQQQWNNFALQANQRGFEALHQVVNMGMQMAQEEQRAAGRLREAAVIAEANKEAAIQNFRETREWIKDPKNLAAVALGVGLTVLSGYGAYQATKILAEIVQHAYRNPTLAQETSLLSMKEKIGQFVFGAKVQPNKISDVIMTPEIEHQMTVIDGALKKAVSTDDLLFNMLIWGPPGTGKTMMAQRLARSSGLDFIYFSGSSLDQFSLEEALIKLHELFEYPKKTGKKVVIIIDEAERLLGKRSPGMPEKTAKILTDILTYLGSETSDYMAIALSNRPEDLDEAFLSRCDYRLYVGAPDQNQRARIIKKYATDYLFNTPPVTRVPTLAARLWNKISKPKLQPRIAIAPDALDDAMIEAIARQTDGFVGRDLSKMVFEMRRCAQVSADKTLTKEMVNTVVARKIKEHAQQDGGFKREETRVQSTPAASVAPVVNPAPVKERQPRAKRARTKTVQNS